MVRLIATKLLLEVETVEQTTVSSSIVRLRSRQTKPYLPPTPFNPHNPHNPSNPSNPSNPHNPHNPHSNPLSPLKPPSPVLLALRPPLHGRITAWLPHTEVWCHHPHRTMPHRCWSGS